MVRFHNNQLEWFCTALLISMAAWTIPYPETYLSSRFASVSEWVTTTQLVAFCGALGIIRLAGLMVRTGLAAPIARIVGACGGGLLFALLMLSAINYFAATGTPTPGISTFMLLTVAEFYSMNHVTSGVRWSASRGCWRTSVK